jgi:hypothetical protein
MTLATYDLQGAPIVVGLVYWPGGLLSDWGDPETGLNPCNSEVQANLVSTVNIYCPAELKLSG